MSRLAAQAIGGGDGKPLEQVMLDFMSLGQRFNWDQLAVFAGHIEEPETLRTLANRDATDAGERGGDFLGGGIDPASRRRSQFT